MSHCHSKGVEIVIVSSCKSFDQNELNPKALVLYASSKSIKKKLFYIKK